MSVIKIACFCMLLCFESSGFVVKNTENDLFRLDIVHYNDFHARFEETSVDFPVCQTNDTKCLGGFSRLYHEITELMKEKPGSILLNAGDSFQGTYWYTLMKWNITQKFINMLPNDVHAIGNHEFDDGIAGMVPYLASLKAPVVAANIDTSAEPALQSLIKPSTVLERKGRRIGVIGLITQETATSSHSEGVLFLDPVESTRKEAKKLTAAGIDIVIVLSHCGLYVDKKIAEEAGENIDIIVGGHTHSLLWNGDSPSHEGVDGPYPVVVEKENGHKVGIGSGNRLDYYMMPDGSSIRISGENILIVTASAFSKYIGNLTTFFDHRGELQSFHGTPVFLNRSIPEDPQITAQMKPYTDELHMMVKEEIAYTNDTLVMTPCGGQECAIGNIIADSLVDYTKQKYESNLTNIAIVLRNSIRGSIAQGVINRGAVINVLPFGNSVVTFRLLGEHIVKALGNCVIKSWVKKPFESPHTPHVSGLRVTLNVTDATATSVLVKTDNKEIKKDKKKSKKSKERKKRYVHYEPIDLDEEYQVTTFDFITFGGSQFDVMKDNAKDITVIGKDELAVEDYMRKITPITAVLDHRLEIVE